MFLLETNEVQLSAPFWMGMMWLAWYFWMRDQHG